MARGLRQADGEGQGEGARRRADHLDVQGPVAATLVALAVAGCSIVLAGDLDDAHKRSSDAGGAGAETSTPDPKGAVDGGSDRDATIEAGPARGCASYLPKPKFCNDFDDGQDLAASFDAIDRKVGDSVRDDSLSFSPPSSAKVTFSTSKSCQYSRFSKDFPGVGGKRFSFGFRFRPAPWTTGFTPVVLELSTPTAYCAGLLYVEAKDGEVSATQINIQSDTKANDIRELDGAPHTNTWTDVRFEVTPHAGGGATWAFTFAPESGPVTTKSLDFPQCPAWTDAAIRVGFHCNNGEAIANYDDIRVDWE